MTRNQAREVWQVIKAYGEGKTVQFWGASGEWFDIEEGFELPIVEKLRIKPEEDNWEEVKKQCDEAKRHLIPYTIEQNTGENKVEGGILSVSGSVSEKHTCKECIGETVFKGKNAYCKNRNCDLPACDNFKSKTEKHYRPFNNCDELVEIYHNRAFIPIVAEGLNQKLKRMYRPEIWVKEKETEIEQLITGFGDTVVKFSPDYTITLKSLLEHYTFLDGSPCGVEE